LFFGLYSLSVRFSRKSYIERSHGGIAITGTGPTRSAPTGSTILCVDDESTPLTIRKLVLQKAGYRVITALSAGHALDVLSETKIDLVISDHLMPDMTGVELAARIKQRFPTLPFVLLSGVNDLPVGSEAADAFISKLEGPEAMIDKIHSLLQK